ncbi:phage tail protein [Streptomyces sp. NPDC006446]|uniref:phage tail protein n=1 Tax=Streptomyces sp. NPDC006446 TaxID=3154301 RepID=UPI0033B4B961
MSAFRWLSGGDWAAARRTGVDVDDAGNLVLSPGGGPSTRRGVALLPADRPTPAQVDSATADRWRRVLVRIAEPPPTDCWLRIWTLVSSSAADPTPPGPADSDSDRAVLPTPAGRWRAAALDSLDARVLCPDEGLLWVAVELGGVGSATPRVVDVRVETGDDGPVTALPVAYRTDLPHRPPGGAPSDSGDGILGRYLGLLGGVLEQSSSILAELPALLNPAAAPDRADAPWITRLASWVALDAAVLPADEASRRETVGTAVERHGRRGTRRGLLDQIHRETGLAVEVVEPLQGASVWRLDGRAATGALGLTTGLTAADPGPPVLDRSARLDAAMLIEPAEAGLPVHARLAHRICVHVPDGTPDQVAAVDRVVQRERPAHVLARTSAVTHHTRVPTEIGIDTLPGPDPRGLPADSAARNHVDGPGRRIGTARLPASDRTGAPTGESQ